MFRAVGMSKVARVIRAGLLGISGFFVTLEMLE